VVDLLVLLNAMVPAPGETAGEWWGHVGHERARAGRPAAQDGPLGQVRPLDLAVEQREDRLDFPSVERRVAGCGRTGL